MLIQTFIQFLYLRKVAIRVMYFYKKYLPQNPFCKLTVDHHISFADHL